MQPYRLAGGNYYVLRELPEDLSGELPPGLHKKRLFSQSRSPRSGDLEWAYCPPAQCWLPVAVYPGSSAATDNPTLLRNAFKLHANGQAPLIHYVGSALTRRLTRRFAID